MSEPIDRHAGAGGVDLDVALARVRESVRVPARPDYAELVRQRLDEGSAPAGSRGVAAGTDRRPLRPLVAAAMMALVVVAATLAFPASRTAVADLFGLSGVRVVPLSPSTAAPRTSIDEASDFGEPVALAEARSRVSFDIAVPTGHSIGVPDSVYVQTGPGIESVTLVYRPRPGFPEILHSQVGLILSEYAGSAAPYFDKYIDQRHPPTPVTVAGLWPGLRFGGPQQVFVRDPSGVVHDEHPRVSAPSLVWQRGAVTYRLEAGVDKQSGLDVAASLQ